MELNSNEVLQHQRELQAVPDLEIILIAEMQFTNEIFTRFEGCNVHHTLHPHNTTKGGTVIHIKETIIHHHEL